ncbi:NMT1-domain-containing protein [Wallemia mellicola CBS 633.66]|uniref:4-amino-5-hydroxymethyl-2-methylpyrimidine phosphate synthase n=1 Tax=Wallemia mellicola (strain ATCC MYA-4683 / CBS 633.66) TaxID=671144 RepID=I4Y6A9_WALMC|nr:NMT1-domain-containing protein [Wallemia mellicola CBS 633.66]EIM19501.1 NMT1-domain-containing protein [Wallemia mellicola CBS 633.66]|eukprot:XP_006960426.1 NMT1-domain-containing protein [Wallemia mellicola CBS 633.66]
MQQQTKPIDIVCSTNWELSPYHVPLIIAKYKGYFKDENLRVATIHPEDVSDVTEIVGSGKADLGLKAMIHTLAGKARGYPVKSIGTLMDEPFTGLLYLEGNGVTEDFRSLKGKKIGYVGEFGKVQVAELAQAYGMGEDEYEAVRCGMNISKALIDGKIHAGIGLENMQQVELEEWCKANGRPASDVKMLRIDQLAELGCCCFCSILYIGNEAWLEAHPNEARGFMKAVKRAADDLIKDPKGTWELFQEHKPSMRTTLASLQYARSYNYMRSDLANVDRDWKKVTGYAQRLGIFPQDLKPNYTNEYLTWELDDEEKVDGNAKQIEMVKKQAEVAQSGGVLVDATA